MTKGWPLGRSRHPVQSKHLPWSICIICFSLILHCPKHTILLLPPTPPLQVTDHCHLLSIQTNMPNPNPNPNPSKPVLMWVSFQLFNRQLGIHKAIRSDVCNVKPGYLIDKQLLPVALCFQLFGRLNLGEFPDRLGYKAHPSFQIELFV